jgi:diaminohydroxyphosphoribosylaminopyrimidine deaminase/5-amino-6-(5-phosphoribosylamino)uracil reductase
MSERDERFMTQALRQARKGEGRTWPNPAVGAVIVAGERILSRGYHRRAGTDHAEVDALRKLGFVVPSEAELYVTLEPCDHQGRTGSCTDVILRAGLRRVVVGTLDPHPHTDGQGLARLRQAGVEVTVGVREAACRELIRGFASVVERGRPWVVLKLASTLDGRIATRTGHSRWITAAPARKEAHRLRNRLDGILVGAGTVRTDDPRLTCRRIPRGRDPLRVVVSGSLDLDPTAQVFTRSDRGPSAVVATRRRASADAARRLKEAGAEVLRLPSSGGRVSLESLLEALAERGLTTLLVEGGAAITASFFERGLVDEVQWFVAPKILGGLEAVPAVAGKGVARMDQALELANVSIRPVGPDWLVRGRPTPPSVGPPKE